MVCKCVDFTLKAISFHIKSDYVLFPFKAHDTGLVTLQVAASSQIISNSVVFEYKARALPALPSSQHDWLSLDGTFEIYLALHHIPLLHSCVFGCHHFAFINFQQYTVNKLSSEFMVFFMHFEYLILYLCIAKCCLSEKPPNG